VKQYETVIGLEVHIELATKTKIFCNCSTGFGGNVNTHICPVCMGMPGALPVLNKKVVEYAIAAGLATNCEIMRTCRFDRKNYFYPDNPQNYQISQLYLPICRNGYIDIVTEDGTKRIGIHEMHMEEDAGKLIHDEDSGESLIDYNRAGVPLIEIVSEPDMSCGEEVVVYLEKLRLIMQYLEISDCKMNEGSMRVDVNLSVREAGSSVLGTRTEMKNLNSFKAVTRAIEYERARQIDILEAGKKVMQETRRWDDNKECSYSMRTKEEAQDYRYFPEPDLMPVYIDDEWLDKIRRKQPEFRDEKRSRYAKEYGIPEYDADIITLYKHMADIFENAAKLCGKPKKVSNWLIGENMRLLKERQMEPEDISFTPENLAMLVELTENGIINGAVAKEVFAVMFEKDISPKEYVETHGLMMENNEDRLKEIITKVLSENVQSVEDYRKGKDRALGFLVGQTMKATKGKANPELVNRLILTELNK